MLGGDHRLNRTAPNNQSRRRNTFSSIFSPDKTTYQKDIRGNKQTTTFQNEVAKRRNSESIPPQQRKRHQHQDPETLCNHKSCQYSTFNQSIEKPSSLDSTLHKNNIAQLSKHINKSFCHQSQLVTVASTEQARARQDLDHTAQINTKPTSQNPTSPRFNPEESYQNSETAKGQQLYNETIISKLSEIQFQLTELSLQCKTLGRSQKVIIEKRPPHLEISAIKVTADLEPIGTQYTNTHLFSNQYNPPPAPTTEKFPNYAIITRPNFYVEENPPLLDEASSAVTSELSSIPIEYLGEELDARHLSVTQEEKIQFSDPFSKDHKGTNQLVEIPLSANLIHQDLDKRRTPFVNSGLD